MKKPRPAARADRFKSKDKPAAARPHAARLPAYLSRSILVLAGFILSAPLFVSGRFYYPDLFLKNILFRVAAQGMVLLYVVLTVLVPSYKPKLHRISYALLAWFATMLISSLPGISVDAWTSWWGDFTRMGGMFTQLHLLAYFFVLAHTLRRERDWVALFTAALFFGVLMGFTGLVQYLNLDYIYRFVPEPEDRIRGAAGNSILYGAYMMLNLFIVFWFLGREDGKEVYPIMARYWLALLVLLDVSLVVWEVVAPEALSIGITLFPVVMFALLVHGASLCWFLKRESIIAGRLFLGCLGLYCCFWLYQSRTRGAVLGLFGSLTLILIIYLFAGPSRRTKLIIFGLTLLLVVLLAIIATHRQSPWLKDHPALARLTQLSSVSLSYRILSGNAGVLGFLDRPIFGWGLENYRNAFDLHFPPKVFYNQLYPEIWYDRAHNMIVDVGAMTGSLGILGFLTFYALIFVFLFRRWFRTKDGSTLLIAGFLLAYLIQAFSSFDSVNTDGIVFLVLAYIAYLCWQEGGQVVEARIQPSSTSPIVWKSATLIAGVVVAISAAFWYLVKVPSESNLLLRSALHLEKALDLQTNSPHYVFRDETVALFRKANDCETTGRHQVREEFCNYASELAQAADVPLEEKVRALNIGVGFLEDSIRQDARNARHYMYFASLINRGFKALQQHDPGMARSLAEKSLGLLQTAERLSPTRPQVYFEMGQGLASLGRFADAAVAFEKGVDLNPAQKEPHVDLVNMYILAGRYADAAREWQRIKALALFSLTRADYDLVLRSYNSMKQFAPMADLYREQLRETPNDAVLLSNLAATYRELGQLDLARETAVKAATLSPELKASLQQFLDSLKNPR